MTASDGRAVVSYRYTAYHSLVCGADPGGDLFKLRVRSGKQFVVGGISRSGAESQIRCTVNRPAKKGASFNKFQLTVRYAQSIKNHTKTNANGAILAGKIDQSNPRVSPWSYNLASRLYAYSCNSHVDPKDMRRSLF